MANHLEFMHKAIAVKADLAKVKSNWMEDVVELLRNSPNLSDKDKSELTRRKVDSAMNGGLRNELWIDEISRALDFVSDYYSKERKNWEKETKRYAQKSARLQQAV